MVGVIDTFPLSALLFLEILYHPLVKDYKLKMVKLNKHLTGEELMCHLE